MELNRTAFDRHEQMFEREKADRKTDRILAELKDLRESRGPSARRCWR